MLVPLERRLARFVLPRIPSWLETYHLTLLTPVWSIIMVVFSYFAARDLPRLWMVNLMIVCHYLTDHFDGKLGKYRNTGLYRWGFYMDHLFDYGFLTSILMGYALLIPRRAYFNMLLVLCVFSAFIFHVPDAGGEGRIHGQLSLLGPTEMRIALIVCNGLLVKFGIRPLKGPLPWIAGCGVGRPGGAGLSRSAKTLETCYAVQQSGSTELKAPFSATKTELCASNCCFPGEQAIKTEHSFNEFVSLISQINLLPQKYMSEKKVVKVVKRAERGKRIVGAKAARDAKRKTARHMVANVTDWVSEFQQKQRLETAEAFDNLIRARQQPNEA